ncbi:MAG: GNAT family N-acetyltransferase [Ginsengibacter sp.]
MNVTIRQVSRQDFPTILSLIKEFSIFQKTPEKVTITLEQMLRDENIFKCLVAEDDDKEITGFATFFFTYYSWSGKGLYLDDLYVKEACRQQAIGKKLLDKIIEIAKEENCKRVRWLVSNWNKNAIDFYKKMGAVIDVTDINCDLLLS